MESPKTSSIPVLVWIGALIANSAVIVLISSALNSFWPLAFFLNIIYTIVLWVAARRVDKMSRETTGKYKMVGDRSPLDMPVFLLYSMFALSIFALGTYIPVNVLYYPDGAQWGNNQLPSTFQDLPDDASEEMMYWAYSPDESKWPTILEYKENLYFSNESLCVYDGTQVRKIPNTHSLRAFLVLKETFFLTLEQNLFSLKENGDLERLSNESHYIHGFAVFKEKLWFQYYYEHEDRLGYSDGTVEGTLFFGNSTASDGIRERVPRRRDTSAMLWGVLFMAELPYIFVTGLLSWKKRLPSLWLNIYSALFIFFELVWQISRVDKEEYRNSDTYWRIVLSAISVSSCGGCTWWVKVHKTISRHMFWLISINSGVFLMTAMSLTIFRSDEFGNWFLFTILVLFLLGVALVSGVSPSMGFVGLGVIIIVFRISFSTGGVGSFFLMSLFGIGVVYVGVLYTRKKDFITQEIQRKFGIEILSSGREHTDDREQND